MLRRHPLNCLRAERGAWCGDGFDVVGIGVGCEFGGVFLGLGETG